MRITREIEIEIDEADILEDISDDDLMEEMRSRHNIKDSLDGVSLLTVYEEFARRGDAPQCLREYIYNHIGRILP